MLLKDLKTFKSIRGRGKFAVVRSLDIDTLDLAYISLRAVMTHISDGVTAQSLAFSIGREVQEHLRFTKWKKQNTAQAKALESYLDSHVGQNRLRVISKNMADFTYDLGPEVRRSIGLLIIELLVGYGFLFPYKQEQKQLIRLSDEVLELFAQLTESYKGLLPIKLPMVIPPVEWSTMNDGGYLTIKSPLVVLKEHSSYEDYPTNTIPFGPINKLQAVGWRINKSVLKILKELQGSGIAGLPLSKEAQPQPLTIENQEYQRLEREDPQKLKELLYKRRLQKNINQIEDSHRINLSLKLWIADTMSKYETIWFTPFLDYRGRFYYSQSYLSPQGDDISKGLLEFSEAKAILPEDLDVLKINIANLWGNDKVSYTNRLSWFDETWVLDMAKDPLENFGWTEADKPWQFLAAILDYKGVIEGNPSRLPVWIDGTCNGLQHYAALLRDPSTAQEVNLMESEVPSDIYSRVAEIAKDLIDNDKRALSDHTIWTYRDFWLPKVNRSLVKRPVMTLPYGVTFFGIKQQIIEDNKKDKPQFFGRLHAGKAAEYLAEKIMEAMKSTLEGAISGMGWLKSIATQVGQNDITWFTPDGFYVAQSYKTFSKTRVETLFGKKSVRLWFINPTQKINTSKQKGGIAPNFIHSLDATHLRMVASRFLEKDKSMGVIHDSFSTHACDIKHLQDIVKDEFFRLHENSILEQFKEQLEDQTGQSLPKVPPRGSYDLHNVYKSEYFFS